MTDVWITVGVLAVATAAIRAAGPVLLGGRELPARAQGVIELLAPALLAGLVVVETLGTAEGGKLVFDARIAGVAAAAAVLGLGRGALPAVVVAALVTALVRAVT
jgi:branched-subunit amino acid transport protein